MAGHIDHGKSSVVQALTGGTVDRLPEEKRRGMTIELGFAHFDINGIRFSFIDVPGHERFIHTMLAGATGVDLALLVVAADDSVMPQTREHLALLQLLNVPRGVIALTKCDLADDEQLEMVQLEIAELVEETFLERAPIVRVSTRSGLGIAELQQALVAAAQSCTEHATADSRFRLPIDRVFSPSGSGTVVTGTVWRGTARVGDILHLLPSETAVRIRRLQSQGADVDVVSAGERAAINLAGVKSSTIKRGDELATPQTFEPARRHLVHLRCLPDAEHSIKHRDRVRIHLGAGQATAQVLMTDKREILPGEEVFAVVKCGTPIVADYGQPFVIRQLSPARTIGGGTIIGPALRPVDRLTRCLAAASGLAERDPELRLAAYIDLRREAEFDAAIESRVGLSRSQCETAVQRLVERKAVIRIPDSPIRYVTTQRFQQIEQAVLARCKSELEKRRPASQLPLAIVLSAMSREASPAVLDAAVEDLIVLGELVRRGEQIGPRAGAELSHRQRKVLELLLSECATAGRAPPVLKEFATRQGCALRDLELLVEVAVIERHLDRISPDLAIDHAALEDLRTNLADYLQSHATFTTSEIREHWGITRKHAVPILEFFDRQQITVRNGDVRSGGPRLHLPQTEAVL